MKKIELKGLDIDLFKETLNNGLEIYMLPYDNKKNYYISYATKYGSDILSFSDRDGTVYTPPLGVAHFLEHKMFEEDTGVDPFTFFQESGTDANASTSYDNTQYICYGNKKFKENLKFLIKFVNNPYFTDDNVEKEKGIIVEEIKMYEDLPDFKLESKLRECVYKNSPRKYDIAGTIKDVNSITKKDLFDCYKYFYTPNNMFILIVGNFDMDEALEVIRDSLDYKENFDEVFPLKVEEENKVYKDNLVFSDTIEIPKVGIGLKVPINNLNLGDVELDLYLNMFTNILFGSSSLFREKVRNEKLLSGIYTEWESWDNFKTFYIMASTINPDKLVDEIINEFNNISISEDAFNRIKKVWIANEVKVIDNVERAEASLFDDIINYDRVISNRIDLIRNMKISVLKKIIHEIDFNNISIVKMLSNN